MSTTDEADRDCALCERRATSRCSACKDMWFCSAQCQATLWPVHKVLCQADPTVFRQAPLTKNEMADFEALSTGMYNFLEGAPPGYDAMPLRPLFAATTGVDDWSDTLRLLVSPVTDPTPEDEFDDVREDSIAMARCQLAAKYNYCDPDAGVPPPVSTPWIEMAQCITLVGVAYGQIVAERGDEEPVHGTARSIKELNAFLRQSLIQCTLHYHVLKATSVPDMLPWVPLLCLSRDRAVATLLDPSKTSAMDPRIVELLRSDIAHRYQELQSMVAGPDGSMPPAVHP
ncbi:hypothetical protein JCM3774_006052 [Rhodotorula dairenensis]